MWKKQKSLHSMNFYYAREIVEPLHTTIVSSQDTGSGETVGEDAAAISQSLVLSWPYAAAVAAREYSILALNHMQQLSDQNS